MRINITGNAGVGKTTLSKRLSAELGLPLIEMDRIVWGPGWKEVPKDERERRLLPLLEQEVWVVDGVSRKARELADIIVFIDLPSSLCVWRCARRILKYGLGARAGLPPHCPEWKIIPRLLQIIYKFPSTARKIILEDIGKRNRSDLILRSQNEINDLYKLSVNEKSLESLLFKEMQK